MKRIIIDVEYCTHCPNFCRDDADYTYMWCGHKKFDYGYDGDIDNRIRKEEFIDGFPKWCPLKEV